MTNINEKALRDLYKLPGFHARATLKLLCCFALVRNQSCYIVRSAVRPREPIQKGLSAMLSPFYRDSILMCPINLIETRTFSSGSFRTLICDDIALT
jgi:hypothetical protein